MPNTRRKKEVRSLPTGQAGIKLKVKSLPSPKDREDKEINQVSAALTDKIEFGNESVEQKNKLIMWVGISCIMAIFFIAWIFNLKHEFKSIAKKSANNGFNLSQAKVELDKAMSQVKQSIAQIKQAQSQARGVLTSKPELTPEQINLLKGKLLTEIATGTASSRKK